MTFDSGRFVLRALAVIGMAASLGCEPPKPIQSYRVPKPEVVYDANHIDSSIPRDEDGNELPIEDRSLAAFLPHGGKAWFVKLTGPKEAVEPHVAEFKKMVASFKFADAPDQQPEWTQPTDWERKPGPPPRRATVAIPGTPPLEIAISSLDMPQAGDAGYVLLNVNRWRRQMNLPAIGQRRLSSETEMFPFDGGAGLLVDLLGKQSASGMMAPPMDHPPIARSGQRPVSSPSRNPNGGGADARVKFETPDGWREAPNDAISRVALSAGEGENQVRVTFSDLSAAGGDLASNVNRWRTQVDLPPLSPEETAAQVVKIQAGDHPGDYVELIGADESIYGAIVPVGNRVWFVKLRGSNAAAAKEKSNFRALIASIRFE